MPGRPWEEGQCYHAITTRIGLLLFHEETGRVDPILTGICLGGALLAGAWLLHGRPPKKKAAPPPLGNVFHGVSAERFVGARLANWRLLRPVGRGASAVVYRAVPNDTLELSEACAIKILHPELTNDPIFRGRFNREVQVLRSLNHRNIVRLDDYGEFEGLLYLVTELVNGVPMRKKVRPGGLPVKEAGAFILSLLDTLSYAHGQGVIHRNIKPENIMVRADGMVKIVDFGLARPIVGQSHLTLPGKVLGTPAYMAPEQIGGDSSKLDGRCDQYALGIMLFELLTGRRPFNQAQAVQLLYSQVHLEPPSLLDFCPDLDPRLDRVFRRMVAKNPESRYLTLQDARPELMQALGL